MKITSVQFVGSAARVAECPPERLPEVAVSGRSNVGKSSLLNMLFQRRNLAHVSGTPGKTQNLNYYLVNERFHLVDLPGYGYAKAPAEERNRWSRMMQGFLRTRRALAGVVQLVDCRHEPSREDREMVAWLRETGLPFCVVATKIDKIGRGARAGAVRSITTALAPLEPSAVLLSSAETGEGRDVILGWISRLLEAARQE